MRKFVGVDLESETVKVHGHRMVSDSFYVVNEKTEESIIVGSLDEIDDDLQFFWFD